MSYGLCHINYVISYSPYYWVSMIWTKRYNNIRPKLYGSYQKLVTVNTVYKMTYTGVYNMGCWLCNISYVGKPFSENDNI